MPTILVHACCTTARCRYVFFNEGGGVKSVLSSTGVVDIDNVENQIHLAQTKVGGIPYTQAFKAQTETTIV